MNAIILLTKRELFQQTLQEGKVGGSLRQVSYSSAFNNKMIKIQGKKETLQAIVSILKSLGLLLFNHSIMSESFGVHSL